MLKRRKPGSEGPDDEVTCDGPTCNVRKPKRQMQRMVAGGDGHVCSNRCENLWIKKYIHREDVTGY